MRTKKELNYYMKITFAIKAQKMRKLRQKEENEGQGQLDGV